MTVAARLTGLVVLSAAASLAQGAEIHAVLSSYAPPYQEAWAGFQEELNGAAVMNLAGADTAAGASVVVTFGSKASLQNYGPRTRLIIAMAPSVPEQGEGRVPAAHVCMTPDPQELLARLLALQPGLKRLAFVWQSEFYGKQYLPLLRKAGKSLGVSIDSYQLADSENLPDLLRSVYGKADALWLPPDPLLLSERNFLLFRDFSLANRMPLYVPMPGMVERGATGSVGVSFRAIGQEAARVARETAAGRETRTLNFPASLETTLNRDSAAAVGLKIDAATLKTLSRVTP